MALLIDKTKYFKIDINGNYVIYKNRTARNRVKKVTPPEEVLKKYDEILVEISSLEYRRYHIDEEDLTKAWIAEAFKYYTHAQAFNTKGKYPLMAQYIPDVDKTIPEIIISGRTGLANHVNNLEELYTLIKNSKWFGNSTVEDI